MEIGALLEDMTTKRARKGLKKLIALTPETGRVLREGKEAVIPAAASENVAFQYGLSPGIRLMMESVTSKLISNNR